MPSARGDISGSNVRIYYMSGVGGSDVSLVQRWHQLTLGS